MDDLIENLISIIARINEASDTEFNRLSNSTDEAKRLEEVLASINMYTNGILLELLDYQNKRAEQFDALLGGQTNE